MAETLFSFDDEQVVNDGPVTCLGIEFENDEKRRAFFREELRKKLPELRLIEGFPIGEDDDIIALSDPPYYTACPNPWINDFIKEWEAEKPRLQAEGKRQASFEVKEPYAADVSEGKNNPIYNAHTYHTKVPYPAIIKYLQCYTQPGDIVIDGFCGTGMTGVAAHLCDSEQTIGADIKGHRNCICSDISVISTLISGSYNKSVSGERFRQEASKILDDVYKECSWMYQTQHAPGQFGEIEHMVWSDVFVCPSCGHEIVFYDAAYDPKTGGVKDGFSCPHCNCSLTKRGLQRAIETVYNAPTQTTDEMAKTAPVLIHYKYRGRLYKKPLDDYDKTILKRIDELSIPYWFPTAELSDGCKTFEPKRTNGLKYVFQFYTKRNLYILSSIFDKIGNRSYLKIWFTSQLVNLSKQNRYRPEVSFPYNPLNGTLYVGSLVAESNVFTAYRNKVDKISTAYNLLNHNTNLTCIQSATSLNIESNSVDYIFIDPPFGSNIMYSELNELWENWLKVTTNNKCEAIINSVQKKGLMEYSELLNCSMREFYRVLKPNRWITIEFSNTRASVWNAIQLSLQSAGFIVVSVASLDKQQGSYNAVTSATAVKQDLVVTCYKPGEKLTSIFAHSTDTSNNVWDFVEDVLEHLPVHLLKNNATAAIVERTPKILFDRLIAYYVQHGYSVPIDAADFQKGLKDRFVERDGMFFTAEQAIEYEEKKKETTSFVSLALLVGSEAEGIEWLRRKLEERPKMYSEILPDWMQDLVQPKKGDELPELMQILDENFLKDENGYWHIPNLNDQAQLDAIKTKRLLREFEVYVEAKKVKNARLEALRAGFKECYKNKDFATIIAVGDKIPEELLTTDDVLLRFYDIASSRV